MYLLNSRAARELEFHTKGFNVEVEMLAQMAVQGRITEVPIDYRKRIGNPKLSTLTHGFDILATIFGLARRYNPVFLFSQAAVVAAIPGTAIVAWVLWQWAMVGVFHSGFALAGIMLLLLAMQAFFVGTIALLVKRSQLRVERIVRNEREDRFAFT
jgi:dolichol-phosphate mannosyltransferase